MIWQIASAGEIKSWMNSGVCPKKNKAEYIIGLVACDWAGTKMLKLLRYPPEGKSVHPSISWPTKILTRWESYPSVFLFAWESQGQTKTVSRADSWFRQNSGGIDCFLISTDWLQFVHIEYSLLKNITVMTSKTIKHPIDLLLAFSFSANFQGSHLSGCFVLDFLSRVSFHNFALHKQREQALDGVESIAWIWISFCIWFD